VISPSFIRTPSRKRRRASGRGGRICVLLLKRIIVTLPAPQEMRQGRTAAKFLVANLDTRLSWRPRHCPVFFFAGTMNTVENVANRQARWVVVRKLRYQAFKLHSPAKRTDNARNSLGDIIAVAVREGIDDLWRTITTRGEVAERRSSRAASNQSSTCATIAMLYVCFPLTTSLRFATRSLVTLLFPHPCASDWTKNFAHERLAAMDKDGPSPLRFHVALDAAVCKLSRFRMRMMPAKGYNGW